MIQTYDLAINTLLERTVNTPVGNALETVFSIGSMVSLKAWLADKPSVDTLQVSYWDNGALYNAWCPGMRSVTAKATYARLGNSRRDYAGVRCIAATGSHWLGIDTKSQTVLLYSDKPLS